MFDKLNWWLIACHISLPKSLATNELASKRSHLATKRSFLTTSNLMRQWIKERGILSICYSIWPGANSTKLSRCGGELAMGRNRQQPERKTEREVSLSGEFVSFFLSWFKFWCRRIILIIIPLISMTPRLNVFTFGGVGDSDKGCKYFPVGMKCTSTAMAALT